MLILALVGLNVFLVLGIGILLFLVIGVIAGTVSFSAAFLAMGSGTSGMFETMIVTILVASISALMKEFGGFEAVLSFIRKRANGRRGGMFGIFALTGLMDIATANNTVAIVIAAPIAKEIGDEYKVEPKKVASLLDTASCIFQGIIPYGAQLLVAVGAAQSVADVKLSSIQLMPFLFYQFLLTVCLIVSIVIDKGKAPEADQNK